MFLFFHIKHKMYLHFSMISLHWDGASWSSSLWRASTHSSHIVNTIVTDDLGTIPEIIQSWLAPTSSCDTDWPFTFCKRQLQLTHKIEKSRQIFFIQLWCNFSIKIPNPWFVSWFSANTWCCMLYVRTCHVWQVCTSDRLHWICIRYYQKTSWCSEEHVMVVYVL